MVESMVGQKDMGGGTECKRLFFSTLDNIIGEMNRRFSEWHSQLVKALYALGPDTPNFLDEQKLKPQFQLTNMTLVESQFSVAHQFFKYETARCPGDLWTPAAILQHFSEPLATIPVLLK